MFLNWKVKKLIKHLTITLLLIFALCAPAWGATYKAWFADDGTDVIVGTWDDTECTEGDPCSTLNQAQDVIDDVTSADTVTLYFKYGDTWEEDSAAVSTVNTYGLDIGSNDPTVHITAYGTAGDGKPIFDGTVSDFSAVPTHNTATGPRTWNRMFATAKPGGSFTNIEIRKVYGNGIFLHETADDTTITSCDINNFGDCAIVQNSSTNGLLDDIEIGFCEIHTGQELYRYSKMSGWSGAILLGQKVTGGLTPSGMRIHHNVMYDIYGEGIIAQGGDIEYNVVGDCGSVQIYPCAFESDYGHTNVRYNLLIFSAFSSSIYDTHSGGVRAGVVVYDEGGGGNNNNGVVEIYGNIIIHNKDGIQLKCHDADALWGGEDPECQAEDIFDTVKVYNNLFIDQTDSGLEVSVTGEAIGKIATNAYIYNNSFIMYDKADSASGFCRDRNSVLPDANWHIANNHFYTLGSDGINVDFDTDAVEGDPHLPGEDTHSLDWDGLVSNGTPYYEQVDFDTHLYPLSTSALINAGLTLAGYDATFLTTGTDFRDLPDTETFVETEQGDSGAGWEIGPIVYLGEGDTPPANNICSSAIAHYILDENLLDSTSNDNDLTGEGTPAPAPNGTNTGYGFDGVDQYAHHASLSADMTTMSCFITFSFDAELENEEIQQLIGEWDKGDDHRNWVLQIDGNANGDDNVRLVIGHTDGSVGELEILGSSLDIDHGTIYSILGVYDNVTDAAYLYVCDGDPDSENFGDVLNGSGDGETTADFLDPASRCIEDTPFLVGAALDSASAYSFFDGTIYEVALYGTVKTKTNAQDFAMSQYSDVSAPVVETIKPACSSLTSAGDLTFALAWNQRVITQNDVWTMGVTFDYPVAEQTATYSGRWNEESGWTNSTGTIYYKTTYTEPSAVKEQGVNGVSLTESDGNYGSLTDGQWDWVSNKLYVNVGDDPSDDEIVPTPYETYVTIACAAGWRQNDFDDAEFSDDITLVGSCTIKNQAGVQPGGDTPDYTGLLSGLDAADYPSTDVTTAIAGTFTLGTDGDFVDWDAFTAIYSTPGDDFVVDFTGNLDTDNSGTKRFPITITGTITGDATFDEDYWSIIDLDITGDFKLTGEHVKVE